MWQSIWLVLAQPPDWIAYSIHKTITIPARKGQQCASKSPLTDHLSNLVADLLGASNYMNNPDEPARLMLSCSLLSTLEQVLNMNNI